MIAVVQSQRDIQHIIFTGIRAYLHDQVDIKAHVKNNHLA